MINEGLDYSFKGLEIMMMMFMVMMMMIVMIFFSNFIFLLNI